MHDYFPCGACNEYVSIADGCRHYKPQHRNNDAKRAYYREYSRKRREREKAEIAAFRKMMTNG